MIFDWTQPHGTRLVLVRHGEPDAAARNRCYGALEVALSPHGHAQASRVADFLATAPLAAVYASPRRRTVDTAQPLATRRGLDVRLEPALREIDFGQLEGLTWDEAQARWPALWRDWMERPHEVQFPDGESWPAVRARMVGAAHAIAAAHPGATVALVAHGGPLRALLVDALGLPDAAAFRLEQSYGAVSVVDFLDGAPLVRLVNGVP